MVHEVVVLGAGYAGMPAARRLANQTRSSEVRVTVVNGTPYFVERPRLHQLSVGQEIRDLPLNRYLEPAGIRLVVGWATALDLDARTITVRSDSGTRPVRYDTLVYALGSNIDVDSVPGVAEHADALTGHDAARRLGARAAEVAGRGGRLVVCGGGLTGIEIATEFAETHPDLNVVLVSGRDPGHWLSDKARDHLAAAFTRLGIEVRSGARIREVGPDALVMEDGTTVGFDACAWAGGFRVPELARQAGLATDAGGRVLVDATLRSTSHPDSVYVTGDAAAASGWWGETIAMGCRTGGFTGPYVADALADRLSGREPDPFAFRYIHECISLGRRDAVIQFMHRDETPKNRVLRGRLAVRYKNTVLNSGTWVFGHPGPYRPRRRRVTATATAAVSTAGSS